MDNDENEHENYMHLKLILILQIIQLRFYEEKIKEIVFFIIMAFWEYEKRNYWAFFSVQSHFYSLINIFYQKTIKLTFL